MANRYQFMAMASKSEIGYMLEIIAQRYESPGHDRRYAINAGKIECELGWRPAETFETGIRKTVQWYLDNPAWVDGVVSGAYRDWLNKQYS